MDMIPFLNGNFMKKYVYLFLICGLLLSLTGCFKRDHLENISVITTVYPLEYVTNILYGDHSSVASMYPNDTDSFTYEFSDKQVQDFSQKDLLIYNGITDDKNLAFEFSNKNKDLLIIDATYGVDVLYHNSELWLNPSNLLMLSQNIRDGLEEYITNSYLKKEIEKNYEELKVTLSELDAELRLTASNAGRKTIVVNSDALKFLEKYGFNVISLDDKNVAISEKTVQEVNDLITAKQVTSIFLLEHEKNSAELEQILESTKIATSTFRRLDTITDQERDNNDNYLTLMYQNIELLKAELYE